MAFRRFRSTQVPTAAICTILARRNKEGKQTHVTFLDLKKAFDSVHRGAIWEAMQNQGISVGLTNAIRTMYKNTTSQYLTHYGLTEEVGMERGVRQGCPMSPTLFSLTINPILKKLEETDNKLEIHGIKMNHMASTQMT